MKGTRVRITQGRLLFSRLVREGFDKKQNIIITKRQKPVAVIIPNNEYRRLHRFEGYRKFMEVREALLKAGVIVKDVYNESKMELERRPRSGPYRIRAGI